ncbi:GNAT family N-acetyltransferase [Streptomyces sp. WMMC500]|uniref:GNAT family N-acetyltransferase n=1 Tax=Streptomyces sp. WMMC500 TaxID=3015154 RepID=UPI00248BC7E0|nr:GNAT family N-acetyltransferase [Streptomyces sp. WMMC500]WBB60378.1 GNAT family N-acetyltransferase [Streptomyces sp. WMMC500]
MAHVPVPYEVSTDPARLDRALVHRWLSTDAYWALGRSREQQDTAIDHSLNFGVYAPEGTPEGAPGGAPGGGRVQVAYARVVTDRATFAWLCDVYVARAARGAGVGTGLVATVLDHLAPYRLRRVLLATGDAHGVYAKHGFAPLADPTQWMALGRA